MSLVLFRNGKLFDGLAAETRDGLEVLVENDRIKEVSDTPISAAAARVVDLAGRTLMPGLIDAHFHAVAADPNLGHVENMPPSLIAQYSRGFLEASVRRGFTTIRDAGGADYGLARAIETGLIAGPRLFYSGRALSQTGGHGDFRPYEQDFGLCSCGLGARVISRIADGVPEVRRAARDELRKGATQIKIMASGGVASPSDPTWVLQFSEEEIRAIVWEARSWRTYVMAHAYTPEAIRRCVEYGVRSIEHGNLIDAETAAHVAEQGAFVVPTLCTYDALSRHGSALGFPKLSLEKLDSVHAAGLEALELLRTAGVKIGFGTDLLGPMHEHQLSEFAIRARVLSNRAVNFGHALKNTLAPVITITGLQIGSLIAFAIITEATLSFLGVGVPPTQPSLGTLIRFGNNFLFSGEWWMTIFPGLALVILALAVNLLGDWLRDALNPKLR